MYKLGSFNLVIKALYDILVSILFHEMYYNDDLSSAKISQQKAWKYSLC